MSSTASDGCQRPDEHTPCPDGLIAWQSWAQTMTANGHKQRRCSGCGLYRVWVGTRPEAPIAPHLLVCLNALA